MASFGMVIPSFGEFAEPPVARDLVQLAEGLGFADVWYGDHIIVPGYAASIIPPGWLDPIAQCLVGLAQTSTLRFGTEVLVAPYRNPLVVAKLAATADHLTGGRLTLGFGVGYLRGEFEALGTPPFEDRGAVTDEYLEVLRLLWDGDGGPLSFHGDHVRFDDAWFGPPSVQDPMPLWVGGNGPRAHRRAARLGTGWHPLFPTPTAYRQGREAITAQRPGGAGGFTFSYSCGVTKLDTGGGPYATGSWADVEGVPDDFSYAPPMPGTPDGRPHFMGTPDQVARDIDEYVGAGVEHFALRFATGGPETTPAQVTEQAERFAREVLPRHDPR